MKEAELLNEFEAKFEKADSKISRNFLDEAIAILFELTEIATKRQKK